MSKKRRKAHVLAGELRLTRDERIEFARMLVADEDIQTWSDLTDEQVVRVLDGLEGFLFITWLLTQRNPQADNPDDPMKGS